MKIGIDIDGVLADFNASFIDRVIEVTGVDRFPARPFDIPTWDYPSVYGYTDGEITRVWQILTKDQTFWARLNPLPGARAFLAKASEASGAHDLYFITSRPGIRAKQQTESWLWMNGGPLLPTVLISSMKGWCARALELDAYLDDRDKNVVDTRRANPGGYTFLLDQPWNRTPVASSEPGIIRITRSVEFLERFGL